MGRKVLRLLNGLITFVVTVCLLAAGAYAGYALWDNQQIYDTAENVFSELKDIRSTIQTPTLSAMEQMIEESRREREAAAQKTDEVAENPTAETEPSEPGTHIAAAVEENSQDDASTVAETIDVGNTAAEIISETPTQSVGIAEGTPLVAEATLAPIAGSLKEAEIAVDVTIDERAVTVTDAPIESSVSTPEQAAVISSEQSPSEETTPEPTAEPTPEPTPDNSPFGQLKQINPDITAWLTMPGTAIDYPVLQGSSNYSYINTDPYGNFSLSGSIFLDSRNNANYEDRYSLLYGHNMSQHRMFSDINLYKDEEFFNENTLGMMLLPDGCHILESLSVIVTSASNSGLFNPENWNSLDEAGILRLAQKDAKYTCEKGMEALRVKLDAGETPHIVSLSTCSDEYTDARTILLTLMDP